MDATGSIAGTLNGYQLQLSRCDPSSAGEVGFKASRAQLHVTTIEHASAAPVDIRGVLVSSADSQRMRPVSPARLILDPSVKGRLIVDGSNGAAVLSGPLLVSGAPKFETREQYYQFLVDRRNAIAVTDSGGRLVGARGDIVFVGRPVLMNVGGPVPLGGDEAAAAVLLDRSAGAMSMFDKVGTCGHAGQSCCASSYNPAGGAPAAAIGTCSGALECTANGCAAPPAPPACGAGGQQCCNLGTFGDRQQPTLVCNTPSLRCFTTGVADQAGRCDACGGAGQPACSDRPQTISDVEAAANAARAKADTERRVATAPSGPFKVASHSWYTDAFFFKSVGSESEVVSGGFEKHLYVCFTPLPGFCVRRSGWDELTLSPSYAIEASEAPVYASCGNLSVGPIKMKDVESISHSLWAVGLGSLSFDSSGNPTGYTPPAAGAVHVKGVSTNHFSIGAGGSVSDHSEAGSPCARTP